MCIKEGGPCHWADLGRGTWQSLETVLPVTSERQTCWHPAGKEQGCCHRPSMWGDSPHGEQPTPHVNSANVENPWARSPVWRSEVGVVSSSEQNTVEWPEALG